MTASELLVLLGRAWSRLLLYPGGLAGFAAAWLIFTLFSKQEPRTGTRRVNQESLNIGGSRFSALGSVALPWLALALLPLPLAVTLPRQVDIVAVLALLEWPQILAIGQALRAGQVRRLAAALNGYPPLILAILALAQSTGSLEIAALARAPGDLASASASALHWIGAAALALALPPALGLGPFAGDRPFDPAQGRRPTLRPGSGQATEDRRLHWRSRIPYLGGIQLSLARFFAGGALELGLRLRALGLIGLAALPWSGSQDDGGWALLRALAAACAIVALLWGYDRLTRSQPARRWARAYLALDGALLLALLWAAYRALQSRLA